MKPLLAAASLIGLLSAAPSLAGDSGLHILSAIHIGGTGSWDYASFDTVTRKLYVTHGASLAVIEVDSGAVNPHLADASGAHIALPLGDGKTLLMTQGKASKASFIDAATGADLGDIATASKPDGAILDPLTGNIFVLDNGGEQIDVIDPKTRALVGKIALAGAPEGGIADGRGLVFTHFEDKNQIAVIDTRSLSVRAIYDLKDCDEPTGMAFVPDRRLLLSACQGGIARVTNADTGAEVATVAVGQHPDAALYDETAKLGYVPSGDGKLTVISFDGRPHVVDVITTKTGARTAALDPKTGRIYLPTADYGPPGKAGDHPSIIADTFQVLVVGK